MQPFARVKMNMQSKYRRGAMLSYGVIGLGIMGIMVGFNYLAVLYSRVPHRKRWEIVIALSIVAILAGIVGALSAQPKGGMAAFSSVIMLGVIASIGIVALTAGTIYLFVLQNQEHAYLLLGAGAVCLIGGITCGIFAQSRARATSY
jgi:hypothetical protein